MKLLRQQVVVVRPQQGERPVRPRPPFLNTRRILLLALLALPLSAQNSDLGFLFGATPQRTEIRDGVIRTSTEGSCRSTMPGNFARGPLGVSMSKCRLSSSPVPALNWYADFRPLRRQRLLHSRPPLSIQLHAPYCGVRGGRSRLRVPSCRVRLRDGPRQNHTESASSRTGRRRRRWPGRSAHTALEPTRGDARFH